MCNRKFLLLLLFILFQLKAFSAVFVVTSNADSGPGTLRDALTQATANGTSEKDYINFNLPGGTDASRTIILKTQLPDLLGNLVIDGTTQPGAAFGVSNAKVILTFADSTKLLTFFNFSLSNQPTNTFELYGMYLQGFSSSPFITAINSSNCALTIGAPNKGNVFSGLNIGIMGDLTNAVIQSNFFGLKPDGETLLANRTSIASTYQLNGLLIGGNDPADGNVFTGGYDNTLSFGIGSEPGGPSASIENNYFGTDYKGTTKLGYNYNNFIYLNDSYTLDITNNVFSAAQVAIEAFNSATLIVKGNYFGTDKTQTHTLGNGGEAIVQNSFVNATIGGTNASDQNVFTGYDNPIDNYNFSKTDVIQNKFYCNSSVFFNYGTGNYVRIIKLTDNEVSGDAPPGATVQLYYTTSSCPTCNPTTWFATVTADANGTWDYKGDTKQNIMVSSTVGGNTFGFQPYVIEQSEVTVTDSDCHHPGSIEINEKRQGRFQFIWKDAKGNVVGTDQKISNLGPGNYSLQINEGGTCPVGNGQFTVNNLMPRVYPATIQLDCNSPTATLYAYPELASDFTVANYYWMDSTKKVISTDQTVKGLPAGRYYLYITDSNGCNSDTVLYQVLPALPLPVIDASKIVIKSADCGSSNGSITGLTISSIGVNDYGWSKPDGTIISYDQLDLINVPEEDYYFFIYSDYNCAPAKSSLFTVGSKNGITLDESKATATSASCNLSNGSVTGIAITGATQYVWVAAGGKSYTTTTPDLTGVLAGSYTLTASNGTGCTKSSQAYQIGQKPPIQFQLGMANSINLTCSPTLSASISLTAPDPGMKSFRWVNSQNQTVGTGQTINNLLPGTYQLYITDENGCENYYSSYVVPQYSKFAVAPSSEIVNEQCGLKSGSIGAANVTGGIPPYAYSWSDASGTQIGTDNTIANLAAGTYFLNVSDGACGNIILSYTITEETEDIPPPSVSNVQLCSSGSAMLSVNNASDNTTYRLYDDAKTTQPLAEQTGGRFNVTVSANRSYFISQLNGTCESSRAEVKVTVGLSTLNIANTFTPNGDGINDYWQISNIDNYPNALVQVFNRYGLKLFESKGYTKPFDGTSNGKKLPSGVYYYIISLSTNCNLLSGSLTIIR